MGLPKRYIYLEPVNMTLFGERAFVDIMEDLNMRFYWVGHKFRGRCSYKIREGQVNIEAGI